MIPESHKGRTAVDTASAPATKPVQAGCDCIHMMNKALEDKNLELNTTIPLRAGDVAKPILSTLFINESKKRRGEKPPSVYPKFCPFCGAEYEPKETPSHDR